MDFEIETLDSFLRDMLGPDEETMTTMATMTTVPAFHTTSQNVDETPQSHEVVAGTPLSQEIAANVYEMPPQAEAAATWNLVDSWQPSSYELTPSPSEPMVCDEVWSPESFVADVKKAKVAERSSEGSPKAPRKSHKDRKEHVLKADNIVHWLAKQVS